MEFTYTEAGRMIGRTDKETSIYARANLERVAQTCIFEAVVTSSRGEEARSADLRIAAQVVRKFAGLKPVARNDDVAQTKKMQ